MVLDYTQIKKRFVLVPPSIKDWLGSEKTVEVIQELNDRFKLEGVRYSVVAQTLLKLETGLTLPDQFLPELAKETQLNEEKVEILGAEITKQILLPIKEDLKKHGIDIAPLEKLLPAGSQQSEASSSSRIPITIETAPSHPSLSTPPPPALKSFARPSGGEQFFKAETTSPNAPKAPGAGEKPADIGPIIIHQETKAESLSTAPKLGFRASENKLPDAKDRPAPLLSAELTVANMPGKKPEDEKEKKPPVTPVVPLGLKLSIGKDLTTPPKTETPSATPPGGILGKIKGVFIKEASPEISSKINLPPPPPPPGGIASIPTKTTQPIQQSSSSTVGISAKIPFQKTDGVGFTPSILPGGKKDEPSISPLPRSEKAAPPDEFIPKIVPASSLVPPTTQPTIPLAPQKMKEAFTPPATNQNLSSKVDLKKVSEATPAAVPPPPEGKKPGIFSRWFQKSESAQKVFTPPEPVKMNTAPSTAPEKKSILPEGPVSASPLPPQPPAPPKMPNLPKAIAESTPQPLPVQKVSPLSNTKEMPLPAPTPAKTVDTISATPKVVNYSAYPTEENK